MRGVIGGILTGGVVSVLGLGIASVVTELPAGVTPPDAPLVEAPMVEPVSAEDDTTRDPSTPVGSLSIEEPQAPALPEGEAMNEEPDAPQASVPEPTAPRADTDPLEEPNVVSIDGTMDAPLTDGGFTVLADPVEPVLPNPQSLPPQTPVNEADLTVSTTPAQPTVVIDSDGDDPVAGDVMADSTSEPEAAVENEDTFVVDLGSDAAPIETEPTEDAPMDQPVDDVLTSTEAETNTAPAPRLQLQGGENSLLGDRETGVMVRRPAGDDTIEDTADADAAPVGAANALVDYAADAGDIGSKQLMSIVLIDDGTMSAASAALAGLPFPVTIALDPALENAAELMDRYRANGFEVAVLAKLPEGALPSDVEVTFESVFSTLPESIAVLDTGNSGLQTDRDVTAQAMEILASQGRGFITVSQGLNMAGRAAEQAGVPAVVVSRDLDGDDQDARVVRRFVDQAAFRARQESGVVLVGRVRPDTISALILWGTANQDDQVAVVPVSAVMNGQ